MGALNTLKDHYQSDNGCDFSEAECKNKGYESTYFERECGQKMERRFLAHHKEFACAYRDYACEHCGYVDCYDAIAGTGKVRRTRPAFLGTAPAGNHYAMCENFPLECPNECGERGIKRKEMGTHLEECPLQPLDCPYKEAGCTHKALRKDMESHVEKSTQEHLMMVFKSFQKANEELKTHIEKLEKKKHMYW